MLPHNRDETTKKRVKKADAQLLRLWPRQGQKGVEKGEHAANIVEQLVARPRERRFQHMKKKRLPAEICKYVGGGGVSAVAVGREN